MNAQAKPRLKPISEKNTKGEILEAYSELIQQLNQESFPEIRTPEEKTVLEKASNETVQKIVTDLGDLRVSINKTISELTDQLTGAAERLTTVQKAINITQTELTETNNIKIQAGLLQRMVVLQNQKQEEFEKDMDLKRKVWEDEQKDYEASSKRMRAREEEEYSYEQSIARKRISEEIAEEKRVWEKQKQDQKEQYGQIVAELEQLRKKVVSFPEEIEKSVKEAINKTIAEDKKEFQTQQSFTKQQTDNQLQIAQLKINTLEETVKTQNIEIANLKKQFEDATRQVRDIAVTVIEGSKKDNLTVPRPSNPSQA